MHRVIVYIDGFNLYYGLRSRNWRRYYWLDIHKLSTKLLKPGQRLKSIRYFTARISDRDGKSKKRKRQNIFLDALGTLPMTDIYFGHYLEKK